MLRILRNNWQTIAVVLAFFLLFGQAVRLGFQPGMPAFGDAWPFPPTVQDAFRNFFSVWDSRNPGINMPAVTIISLLTLPEGVVGWFLGGNMIAAGRLFYFYLPLPLSFISMYWLLGKFIKSRGAKFLAAFIYSANLFSIGELTGGYVSNQYVQVLFPLIVWALYRRSLFSFSLLFALAYSLSDHVVIFIIPFFLLFLVSSVIKNRWRGLASASLFIFVAAFLVILLTLPYTFYYFKVAFPFLGGEPLRPDVLAFLIRNVNDTYRYYTFGNALRLGGSSLIGLFNLNHLAGLPVGDYLVKLGFILPLLAFSWPIFSLNRFGRQIRIGLICTVLASITLLFIFYTGNNEGIPLFLRFPFLFRFRNPARPTLFLAFLYAPLIALSIEGLLDFLRRKTRHGNLAGGIVVLVFFLLISIYLKPFFSGDYTFAKNRGRTYTIAPRYYELGQWLENKGASGESFRVLWLPYNHEEVEMKIRYVDLYPYSVPINYGAYTANDYLKVMKDNYQLTAAGSPTFPSALAKAGVRYIIVNRLSGETGDPRFEYDYQTPWLPGSANTWEGRISGNKDFTSVKELSGFSIYENLKYKAEFVDPTSAGFPPENLKQLQDQKNQTIVIALFSWALVLGGLVYNCSRGRLT